MTRLEELSLAANNIHALPANLERCHSSLTLLDLEHNLLAMLPPVILTLTRLETLCVAGNQIGELPLELGNLAFLKQITVPLADMGGVPRDVVKAGGRAIIRYLCGIQECAHSGLLDLSSMNLRLLPPAIRTVSSALTTLSLDNNPLERLPNWLGEFQLLQRLSLRQTPLARSTPSDFSSHSLAGADETACNRRVPATLGAIASLEDVALDEDSPTLQSPPPTVVSAGTSAILSYLRRSYAAVLHHQLDLSGFGLTQVRMRV